VQGIAVQLSSVFALTAALAFGAPQNQALDLNQSGLELAAQREYVGAEKDYRRSAEIYRSLGEPFEAHLSIVLYNLGESLVGQGRWRESAPMFEEALVLSKRKLAPKHVRTVGILNALGNVRMMLGDEDSAEALLQEAVASGRESTPGDVQFAHALAGLSALRLRQGKPEEALPFAEEALAVTLKADPGEGIETAMMYQNVGQIHRAAMRPERALPLMRKSRSIYERAQDTADPRYASLLSQEGLALMDDGKFVQAEADMKHAIALLNECQGCALNLAVARNNLGLLRLRQKKYAEADDLLRKALAGEEQYNPSDAAQIGVTRDALKQVRNTLR
jgi:tetratricopeptide (TPR) repeat protein